MIPTKIMLISADTSITHSVVTSLIPGGYNVIHSPQGIGAMDLIRKEKPDLVILDLVLPDFNSLAILRSLRSDELNGRIPVILMGANMQEEDVLIGLEIGADLCLLETFHPQVFEARVRSLLRRAEPLKVH
jgi:DNA-binding response OmpR family regulator